MYGHTHAAFGLTVSILLLQPSENAIIPLIAFTALGSLLPDIDLPNTYIRNPKVAFCLLAIITFSKTK